jgi:hypothetical protein
MVGTVVKNADFCPFWALLATASGAPEARCIY